MAVYTCEQAHPVEMFSILSQQFQHIIILPLRSLLSIFRFLHYYYRNFLKVITIITGTSSKFCYYQYYRGLLKVLLLLLQGLPQVLLLLLQDLPDSFVTIITGAGTSSKLILLLQGLLQKQLQYYIV